MFFLFGMRRRTRGIGRFTMACPRCGGTYVQTVVGIKRTFTIFFIPLIPLPETFRATCDNCHKNHSIREDALPTPTTTSGTHTPPTDAPIN
jgi:zinc-ribbon family